MSRLEAKQLRSFHLPPASFTLEAEDLGFLSGPSGVGKTLLLRSLVDLDPHQGEVYLDGTSSSSVTASQWRSYVGYLPTKTVWWRGLVGEHFNTHPDGNDLQALGFDRDVMNWEPRRLSVGEGRRLALLRLLSIKPKVLLLDEPTSNLDQKNIETVEALIRSYQKKHAAPILWVSHDPEQEKRLATRTFQLNYEEFICL